MSKIGKDVSGHRTTALYLTREGKMHGQHNHARRNDTNVHVGTTEREFLKNTENYSLHLFANVTVSQSTLHVLQSGWFIKGASALPSLKF